MMSCMFQNTADSTTSYLPMWDILGYDYGSMSDMIARFCSSLLLAAPLPRCLPDVAIGGFGCQGLDTTLWECRKNGKTDGTGLVV